MHAIRGKWVVGWVVDWTISMMPTVQSLDERFRAVVAIVFRHQQRRPLDDDYTSYNITKYHIKLLSLRTDIDITPDYRPSMQPLRPQGHPPVI